MINIKPKSYLYKDAHGVKIWTFGEFAICIICVFIMSSPAWLFISALVFFGCDALRAVAFYVYGGVSFNYEDKSVRIVNFYRIYNIPAANLNEFNLDSPVLYGSTCTADFVNSHKKVKIRSIYRPLQNKYPERFSKISSMVDEMNTELEKLKAN